MLPTLLLLALLPTQLQAQETAPIDIGSQLEVIRKKHELPALAGLTITSAGIVAEGYGGVQRVGGEQQLQPTDLFHLGSCTKAMTATLVGTYVEEGLLTWDNTLAALYPDLSEGMHADWRGVTLAQLLSHTAGVPGDLKAFRSLAGRVRSPQGSLPESRLDVLKTITAVAPLSKPGTTYLYSNWGYTLAGACVERVSEQSWEDAMGERIFKPLGMASAGFGAPNKRGGSGQPCGHTAKGKPVPGTDNPATIGPAGTVHASLRDWAKFIQLHLRGARGDEGLMLSPETFAALHKSQPGTKNTYGGGWLQVKRSWSKGLILTHSGSNTVWFCCVWIAPESDFAVLAACNRGGDAGSKGCDALVSGMIRTRAKSR